MGAVPNPPLTYRPDIDGLRCLAIVSVVLFHANPNWLPGGFVGVDVFFVISGYLITSVLLKQLASNQFRFSAFLTRRLRRLYPALVAVLAVCLIPTYWFLLPRAAEDSGESIATAAVFLSNFLFFTEDGYFEGAAHLKPLLHTWSLAIEEQYYLLFPPLLVLLFRREMVTVALTVGVVSLLLVSQWLVADHPQSAFFLLPGRAWELLLGALCASLALHRPPALAMSIVGLALIALPMAFYSELTPFPGLSALPVCAGTALCLLGGAQAHIVTRMLSTRPVVFIGLISYSLYLWHWPLFVFTKLAISRPPTTLEAMALIGLSVVLAVLSWRWIEQPFRGAQGRWRNRTFVSACAASAGLLIAAGLLFDQTDGLPGRMSAEEQSLFSRTHLATGAPRACVGREPDSVAADTLCQLGASKPTVDFVLWGDSHAANIAQVVGTAAERRGLKGLNASAYGCAPLLNTAKVPPDPKRPCRSFNAAVFKAVINSGARAVILSARWAAHAEAGSTGFEAGRVTLLADQQGTATTIQQNHAVFSRGLNRTVNALTAQGVNVYVLAGWPEVGVEVPQAAWSRHQLGAASPLTVSRAAHAERQAYARSVLNQIGRQASVSVYDPTLAFCDETSCRTSVGDALLYSDSNHLSRHGTAALETLIAELIADVAASPGTETPRPYPL